MNLQFTSPGFLIFLGGLVLLGFICLLLEMNRAPLANEKDELPPAPKKKTRTAYEIEQDRRIDAYFAQKRLEIQQDVLQAKMHKANAIVRSKLLPNG